MLPQIPRTAWSRRSVQSLGVLPRLSGPPQIRVCALAIYDTMQFVRPAVSTALEQHRPGGEVPREDPRDLRCGTARLQAR